MTSPAQRRFDSVLCFGDSDWWYHNRGHADMQFMRRFARRWPVLYVNSLGVAAPGVAEGRMFWRRVQRKARSMARYCRDGGEGFTVLSPVFMPGLPGRAGRGMYRLLSVQISAVLRALGMRRPLVWVSCPTAAGVLPRLPRAGLVHQLSDCYAALESGASCAVGGMEAQVARAADLIVCSSRRLLERARTLYGKGEYVDHGVDYDLFASAARRQRIPDELRGVPGPIVGFFGNIDGNTVDRALLEAVIGTRPQYRFALVGPMASDFEGLRRFPNVVAVDQRPYGAIPDYGACFDVCLMPWRRSEWIEHCNPIKLKEYLALGKPVVSTPFPELRRCGELCYAAAGAAEFAACIDRALREDTAAQRARRQAWARAHTWEAQFQRVLLLLEERSIAGVGSPESMQIAGDASAPTEKLRPLPGAVSTAAGWNAPASDPGRLTCCNA